MGSGVDTTTLVFRVGAVYTIVGRGICMTPEEWGPAGVQVGDVVHLLRPDGTTISATVQAAVLACALERSGAATQDLLLSPEVSLADVPVGTEVHRSASTE